MQKIGKKIPLSFPLSDRRGFTLVEILVVLAVTSLLTGIILTYTSASRDRIALYVEEAKLAEVVSRSKSMSVSTYNRPQVPCGYGVEIDRGAGAYSIFSYAAPDCAAISTLDDTYKTTVELFTLPKNVRFAPADENSIADILFIPPDPRTWIWIEGSIATTTEGQVELNTPDGGAHAIIRVGSGGQITF